MQPERIVEPALAVLMRRRATQLAPQKTSRIVQNFWNGELAWWNYIQKGDSAAKKMFVGPSCGLCNQPADWGFGTNGKLP